MVVKPLSTRLIKPNFCFQTVIVWRYCNQPREMRTLISYPDLTLSLEISHFQWQSEIWVRDYENTGLWGCRKLCFLELRLINFMFLQTVPWKSGTKEAVSLIWLWKPLLLQNSLWDEETLFCIGFSMTWPTFNQEVLLGFFGIRDIRAKNYRDTGYLRKILLGYRILRSCFRDTGYLQKIVTYQIFEEKRSWITK